MVLWVVQILVGLAFIGAAYSHGFRSDLMKSRPGGEWIAAVPRPLMIFIAACEFLGGVGVVLPMLTGILPWLTPLAAAGLALIMLLAAGFHLMRREYRNLGLNLFLLVLAALVAYGRWTLFS